MAQDMFPLENQRVLVIGLGASGVAACELLQRRGAKVTAVDSADNEKLRAAAASLRDQGVKVVLGATKAPTEDLDLVLVSPGVPWNYPVLKRMEELGFPIIGELELGFQHALCLNVAITGTNGKTTTTELVERLLRQNQIKTIAAGNIGLPLCAVVEQSRELDYLTLEVSSFQLETIKFFRPAVAVLMNLTPDHLDRYASLKDYYLAKARLFMNQQAFDWAIIQSEALAQLRALNASIPSKIITFSASDRKADIYLDGRGLALSRLEGWSGPLIDMDSCGLRGPHNAENVMAALAVGRVLRVPLEGMVAALQSYEPAAHRCELVAEVNGVQYINDSKATNVDALAKALLSVPARSGEANIWLIAGGKDKGFEYHDVGPLLSQRVKGAFLIGEMREKIRAAWSLFTPCILMDSLVEAVTEAARKAVAGDVVLLSPACSSFDQFQNYQHRGEVFRQAVKKLAQPPGENMADGKANANPVGAQRKNEMILNAANVERNSSAAST